MQRREHDRLHNPSYRFSRHRCVANASWDKQYQHRMMYNLILAGSDIHCVEGGRIQSRIRVCTWRSTCIPGCILCSQCVAREDIWGRSCSPRPRISEVVTLGYVRATRDRAHRRPGYSASRGLRIRAGYPASRTDGYAGYLSSLTSSTRHTRALPLCLRRISMALWRALFALV